MANFLVRHAAVPPEARAGRRAPNTLLGSGLALAGLLMALPPAWGAEPGFPVRTVGDLAGICTGGPGGAEKTAAINFCHGYAQGVLSLMRDHEAKSICLPDKPPTRTQTMADFVSWSRAKEERAGAPAARGLEAFFKDRFPCK